MRTVYPVCVIFHFGSFILLRGGLSSLHAQFKKKPFESESLLYLLPLLPAGLRRALYFVSLVGHDDVFLLQEPAAPPHHDVGAQGARALIGGTVVLTEGDVEAGRPGGQAGALWDSVGDLQGAGAGPLRQARAWRGMGPPPDLRLGQRQGGLDVGLATQTAGGRGGVGGREGTEERRV